MLDRVWPVMPVVVPVSEYPLGVGRRASCETSGGSVAGDGGRRSTGDFSGRPGEVERMISHMPPAPRRSAAKIKSGTCSSDNNEGGFAVFDRCVIAGMGFISDKLLIIRSRQQTRPKH